MPYLKKLKNSYHHYFMSIRFDASGIREKLIKISNTYITDWFNLFITQPPDINKTNMKTMIEDDYNDLISHKINLTVSAYYQNISTNLNILKEMVHNISENFCNNDENARLFCLNLTPEHRKKLLAYFMYYKEILRIHENFVFHKKFADGDISIYKDNTLLNNYVKRFAIIQIMKKYMTEEPEKNQEFFDKLSRQNPNFFKKLSQQFGKKDMHPSPGYNHFKHLSENLHSLTKIAINDKNIFKKHHLQTLILTLINKVDETNAEPLKLYFNIP
jgi:hypothetical protein